jgi:hypothetical protein
MGKPVLRGADEIPEGRKDTANRVPVFRAAKKNGRRDIAPAKAGCVGYQ